MSSRARLGGIGLALIAALVFWITLRPTTVDAGFDAKIHWLLSVLHRIGVPSWFQFRQLEFAANIAMFVPLGFFGGLLLGRRWWWAVVTLPVVSLCIEAVQLFFLPSRYATVNDVLANSLGAWIGVGLAVLVGWRLWGVALRSARGHRAPTR